MNPDRSSLPATWSRRGFLKSSGLVLAAIGGAPALAACSGVQGDKSASDDGTLAIRTVEDLQNLDPGFMASSTDDAIMVCIAENLVTYVPGKTEPVNELAEKITSSEDGLTHEFTLKKGVQFHGGYGELTAEDVKFSFERIAGLTKPDIESTYQGDWATLKEVEVTGKYTGVIRLSKPFAPLFYTTLPGNAGLIISKAAYDELGEDFATKPVGTGPYEFVEWKRGQHTTLKRFGKWAHPSEKWADEPQWKRIKFVPIPDDSSADVAVESGEVDLGQIAYSSVKRFKKNGEFKVTTLPTLDYAFVGFNVTHPKLRDVRVRKALRQALDVDSILEAAFDGETRRAHALISEDVPIGHWKDAPRYQPDAAAAKQQLTAAGADGLSLQMGIAEEPGAEQVAEIVQQNLKKVGVKVTIKKYPGDQMHEQVDSLQMFYFSFSNQADPSWATVWFTGDQVGDWNFMSWKNEEYDRLHNAALVELDEDKRNDMYIRMQELMDEDAIAAWVMYRTNHYAHPPEVRPSLIPQRFAKYRAWAVKS